MIAVAVPANTLMVQGYLIEIVTFDIIPEEKTDAAVKWALKKWFNKELEEKEELTGDIPGQIQDFGLDSHYLQKSLSTILALSGVWILKVIVYCIMGVFVKILEPQEQEVADLNA